MAKKQTTSDLIKWALSASLGGKEADWKREGSVTKDAKGNDTRVFTNAALGLGVTVTHMPDGQFNGVTTKGARVNFRLPVAGAFAAAAASPDAEKAADKIIDLLTNAGEEEEGADISEALVKKAGSALAARFTFAVAHSEDAEGFYAIITPTAYWKRTGYCFDQPSPLHRVLPEGEDVNDCGTYEFGGKFKSATEVSDFLKGKGFVWEKKFQQFIDRNNDPKLLPELEGAKPSPKKPRP